MNDQLSHEDFANRAQEIIGVINRMRAEGKAGEVLPLAEERFVDDEPNAELRRLSQVMALARRQALIQTRLDDDRQALHHGRLDHEEATSVGHHYEMLRHQACSYNHLLRGLIESYGQYFSRDELMKWLTAASLGRNVWAKGEVTGAVSEIALHAALQGLPDIRGLRYASVEEDLVGYDFVGEWRGKLLTIDAKTGFYRPLSERKHGHRHLEISVPREVVRDLTINHRGLALLRREVMQVLTRGMDADPREQSYQLQPAPA